MVRPASHHLPIALTMGEPAGVGPFAVAKIWKMRKIKKLPAFLYVGDPRAVLLHAPRLPWKIVTPQDRVQEIFAHALPVWPVQAQGGFVPGRPSIKSAPAVVESIRAAVDLCQKGKTRALVTNPIHKEILLKAGFPHSGHTEYLGRLTQRTPVMMLANDVLRTIPVTVHIPLHRVSHVLRQDLIVSTVEIAFRDLQQRFGLSQPRLAMTGLNPHAGEGGRLGREEISTIVPALRRLARRGIPVEGPLSADSAFSQSQRPLFDCYFAMTHDQALIPVKTLDFHGAVNITLGLPWIRTSPAHGVALAAMRSGTSPNVSSLLKALQMASQLSGARKR